MVRDKTEIRVTIETPIACRSLTVDTGARLSLWQDTDEALLFQRFSSERNFKLCFAAASKGQQMCIIGLENALHFLLTSGALEQCRKTNVP